MNAAKLALVPLLLAWIVPIVLVDSSEHAMYNEVYAESASGMTSPASVMTSPASAGATCDANKLVTAGNHRAYQHQLNDFTFNFFIIACLLESTRSRVALILAHAVLWAYDNSTYEAFSSPSVPRPQRLW